MFHILQNLPILREVAQICRSIVASTASSVASLSPNTFEMVQILYSNTGRIKREIPTIGLDRYGIWNF